ncbi:hypothetical protein ZIOFF_033134 [Zingiber officinale]|uniref:T-complex protein 1 subunit alpha n=1 Tax=Zingiber officinale TaxID=94328 RepID=A0A8J5GI53_ZINOF|nr:hypothetical protein ZIOFF_033134 [Zingiber officinale]
MTQPRVCLCEPISLLRTFFASNPKTLPVPGRSFRTRDLAFLHCRRPASAMAIAAQTPDILGERQSGQDVRTQNGSLSHSSLVSASLSFNCTSVFLAPFLDSLFFHVSGDIVVACQAVANIVKSSLGPVGLDKMLVDDIGDVTITNDGATILKMLEVEHPAAKVLVELAELQDREVGDGTTSVVILAAELLKRANDLVRDRIHPTSIISGFRLAMREACKYVEEKLSVKVEKLGKESLTNCAKTSMSSKLIAIDSDFFANLVRSTQLLLVFLFNLSLTFDLTVLDSLNFLIRQAETYLYGIQEAAYVTSMLKVLMTYDLIRACPTDVMEKKLLGGCKAKQTASLLRTEDCAGYIVVDAVQAVKMTNARGEVKYPIKSINILKAHGKSAKDSYLLNGYALNTGRAAQGMPTRVSPAKIVCLDFNLQKTKMQMGIQVLVTDPRELEKIREREADITKERIQKLLKSGANVVLTTKGIDDMSLKAYNGMVEYHVYFVEAGAIAVRRVRKEDLRHVAKATGATVVHSRQFTLYIPAKCSDTFWFFKIVIYCVGRIPSVQGDREETKEISSCLYSESLFKDEMEKVTTFADMEGEETFDATFLGHADEVVEERIADDDVILIKGTKNSSAVSLILRGANDHMLDEMDRALHDALCIVKRTLESNTLVSIITMLAQVVAGGGAVESALSVYLEYLATTLGSREQLAIAEFAESLLIIPKVLAVNAAKDATELVAKLRAYHHTAQTKADKQHLSSSLYSCVFFVYSMGLDLSKGTIRNNLEAGVIEPAMSKVKIIQFATEAAITILRIDDMIKLVKDELANEDD